MERQTRRSFNQSFLGSLMAYGLIETLFTRDLFADAVRPVVHKWMADLNGLCRDLKDQKLTDTDFQVDASECLDGPQTLRITSSKRLAHAAQ